MQVLKVSTLCNYFTSFGLGLNPVFQEAAGSVSEVSGMIAGAPLLKGLGTSKVLVFLKNPEIIVASPRYDLTVVNNLRTAYGPVYWLWISWIFSVL